MNMFLGAIIVRDDNLPFTLSSATYAIMAAEKDQASQLKEIKVIPPPTLRFEINNERKSTVRNEFFGNLYLHSELLDDMAFLSLSKAMVTSMPKEVFDRVKDQLPPFEVLDMFGLDGMVEILFDDTKDIRIIDKQGLMEIKVVPPTPFRVEIEKPIYTSLGDHWECRSYFNNILLDKETVLNNSKTDLGSNIDRHDNLEKGKIKIEGIKEVIKFCKKLDIPIILETPDEYIVDDLELVKNIIKL